MTDLWQFNRTLSPGDLAEALRVLNLSQAAAGRYLGLSDRTIRRCLRGQAGLPVAAGLLLQGLIVFGITPVVPPRLVKQICPETGATCRHCPRANCRVHSDTIVL